MLEAAKLTQCKHVAISPHYAEQDVAQCLPQLLPRSQTGVNSDLKTLGTKTKESDVGKMIQGKLKSPFHRAHVQAQDRVGQL